MRIRGFQAKNSFFPGRGYSPLCRPLAHWTHSSTPTKPSGAASAFPQNSARFTPTSRRREARVSVTAETDGPSCGSVLAVCRAGPDIIGPSCRPCREESGRGRMRVHHAGVRRGTEKTIRCPFTARRHITDH